MNQQSEGRSKHLLLCVDDEENILHALRRVFRKEPYEILTTVSPKEGLALLESRSVALIISDHRMPEMEGTELLAAVRAKNPDIMRIMLTGYADMKAAIEAINDCQVYRYISKPWNDDDLRLTVQEALRQYDLVQTNRELNELVKEQNKELYEVNRTLESKIRERTKELEKKNQELEGSFYEMIEFFIGLMEMKSAALVGHARRTAILSKEMAIYLQLPEDEQKLCEAAALLMDSGTFGYPDSLIKKQIEQMDPAEQILWQKHPLLAQASLKRIKRMEPVGQIIRFHHEHFDGNGFPDKLKGEMIPLPSHIIAAADYFDLLLNPPGSARRVSLSEAMKALEKEEGKRFDPTVIQALGAIIENVHEIITSDELEVSLEELKEGMTLARNLKTAGGILLLPAQSRLQASHLEKIHNFHKIDPIIGRITIYRNVKDFKSSSR
ncbi:MAG: response regulator [Candidatus Manganitrophaceae bacterium]|nr:MAG: response regulator [Candidatus Manganitrophaceae bacterium]